MTASWAEVETTRSMGVGANMMSASEAPAAIRSLSKCENRNRVTDHRVMLDLLA